MFIFFVCVKSADSYCCVQIESTEAQKERADGDDHTAAKEEEVLFIYVTAVCLSS